MPKKLNSTQKEKRNIEDFSSMTLEERLELSNQLFNDLCFAITGLELNCNG